MSRSLQKHGTARPCHNFSTSYEQKAFRRSTFVESTPRDASSKPRSHSSKRIRPRILEEACGSTGGPRYHEAGLMIAAHLTGSPEPGQTRPTGDGCQKERRSTRTRKPPPTAPAPTTPGSTDRRRCTQAPVRSAPWYQPSRDTPNQPGMTGTTRGRRQTANPACGYRPTKERSKDDRR